MSIFPQTCFNGVGDDPLQYLIVCMGSMFLNSGNVGQVIIELNSVGGVKFIDSDFIQSALIKMIKDGRIFLSVPDFTLRILCVNMIKE